MDGFLIKPLDREKLAEALAGWPRRGTSRRESTSSATHDRQDEIVQFEAAAYVRLRRTTSYSRRSATVSTT